MRTIVIALSACLISAGSFAADQTSTGANSKLAAMLAAKDANGFNTAFIRENFDRGIRSSVYTNAPIGLVFPGDPGFPSSRGPRPSGGRMSERGERWRS